MKELCPMDRLKDFILHGRTNGISLLPTFKTLMPTFIMRGLILIQYLILGIIILIFLFQLNVLPVMHAHAGIITLIFQLPMLLNTQAFTRIMELKQIHRLTMENPL